jgi:3-hydroxybutyryl-CoA dehydrogenase
MTIERVFVVGAGLMGHGIAQVSAAAGKHVTLTDRTAELAEKGKARIGTNLARQVEKEKIDQATADAILGRVATAQGTDAAAGHDIVVEAVFEDETVKRETWAALTRSADADAIFASNTSSISITSLATATDRAPRFIGLHFFSPVPVMGLIEIIRGLETDDATYDACRAFSEELGKTVIESRDYPGFLVNRMLGPFINEAVFALMESTGSAEDIDTGAKLGLNHPMGPLELSDFIGNDVMLNVMDVLHRGFGDPKFRAAPLLRQMVTAGHLGRKTGRGFYRYDEQGKKIGSA